MLMKSTPSFICTHNSQCNICLYENETEKKNLDDRNI